MKIQQAIQQISATGMTDVQIGKKIGAAVSVINRLRNGIHKSTSYERGLKIFALYAERCGALAKPKTVGKPIIK